MSIGLFSWLPTNKLRLKLRFTVNLAFQGVLSFFSFVSFVFFPCRFQSLPPHLKAMSPSQMHAKQVNALQGEVQERNEEVFIKGQLRETEGPDIKETLEDQISQCFIECR